MRWVTHTSSRGWFVSRAPSRHYVPGFYIPPTARLETRSVGTLVLTAEFPKNLDSAVSVIPFPKNYGTISNAVFSLPPSLRPALVHAGMPCGQWVTVQFPNAMPE
jgi:hypothetical protein